MIGSSDESARTAREETARIEQQRKVEAAAEAIDKAASWLANETNDPEAAWFLRGVWDALNNNTHDGPDEYRSHYRAGIRATAVYARDGE